MLLEKEIKMIFIKNGGLRGGSLFRDHLLLVVLLTNSVNHNIQESGLFMSLLKSSKITISDISV